MKTKILIGLFVFALFAGGVFLAQELRARKWESRWNDFFAGWEARGEIFDPAKLAPADPGENSDFARHPWIRRIADGDEMLRQTLDKMEPDGLDGYQEWERATDDNGVHRPMSPELARRVLKHAAIFSVELQAFAEAAQRPGCRLVADGRASTGEMAWSNWAAQLSPLGNLLGASAHASAALGDGPALTRDLETLLLAGNLLRSSNLTLGVVVGSGFESHAFGVIGSIPDLGPWPETERRKWLAALDVRTRTLPDEFAATNRLERGLFLRQMDKLEADRSVRLAKGLTGYGPLRRIYIARARLAACEMLQDMVLSDGGHLAAVIHPDRITRFQSHLENLRDAKLMKKSKLHPAEEFGLLPQFAVLGIQAALIHLETDRSTARERISNALR